MLSSIILAMLGFLDTKCSNCPKDLEDGVGRRSRRGREG